MSRSGFRSLLHICISPVTGRKRKSLSEVARAKNYLSFLILHQFLVRAWRSRLQNIKENIRRRMLSSERPATNSYRKSKNIPKTRSFSFISAKLTLIWDANRRRLKKQDVQWKCRQRE